MKIVEEGAEGDHAGRTADALLGLLQQLTPSHPRHAPGVNADNVGGEQVKARIDRGERSSRHSNTGETKTSEGNGTRGAATTIFNSHTTERPNLRTLTGTELDDRFENNHQQVSAASGRIPDPSHPRVIADPRYSEGNGYPYTLGPDQLADRDSWGAPGYIFDTPALRDGIIKSGRSVSIIPMVSHLLKFMYTAK